MEGRTDGQTDRIPLASTALCIASNAVIKLILRTACLTFKLFVVATAVLKHIATLSTGYRRLPQPIVGNAILLRFSDRAKPRHSCIPCCNIWHTIWAMKHCYGTIQINLSHMLFFWLFFSFWFEKAKNTTAMFTACIGLHVHTDKGCIN